MQLINLKDRKPPAYEYFMAFNKETGEHFENILIHSKFNKFYGAGKPFTHWIEIIP